MVGSSFILASLLALPQEPKVLVEGLLEQPLPETSEYEFSSALFVVTVNALVFPSIHSLLQPDFNAPFESLLDDSALE